MLRNMETHSRAETKQHLGLLSKDPVALLRPNPTPATWTVGTRSPRRGWPCPVSMSPREAAPTRTKTHGGWLNPLGREGPEEGPWVVPTLGRKLKRGLTTQLPQGGDSVPGQSFRIWYQLCQGKHQVSLHAEQDLLVNET